MITNKDYYTYTHSVNVGLYCLAYGVKNNMGENDIRNLGLGGMLHDVGKVKVDAAILNKNGKLTDAEFERILNDRREEHQWHNSDRLVAERFILEIRAALVLAGGREFSNDELKSMTLEEVSALLGSNLEYVGLKIRNGS